MSAEAAVLSRSWRVGRWTATLTLPAVKPGTFVNAVVEWTPELPNHLTPAEMKAYRVGRDTAVAELLELMEQQPKGST